MFVETGKKFMESFSEIKNKNYIVFVTEAFYRFGLF